jgi:hypothetical protein
MKELLIIIFSLMTVVLSAQFAIKVEVSADTIQPGEYLEVTYTIENGEGKFEGPDMTGLPLISGPNTSSSFMIINGKKTSSQSYSYVFRPQKEEILVIPHGYYRENDDMQEIEEITIVVGAANDSSHKKSDIIQSPRPTREKKKF